MSMPIRVAWLSLDEGDNDPARLLAYVVAAVQTISETAEALRYLEEGHARGKVVITVEQNNHTSQSPDHRHPGGNS